MENRKNIKPAFEEKPAKYISKTDKYAQYKKKGHCPVCTARLARNNRGTRHQYRCHQCNAVWAKEIKCKNCRNNQVWRGKEGARCHACGRDYVP